MARRHDAEALEALLQGQASPDDAPRSLTRLSGLATAVRDHTEVEAPTDEFRARLRAELVEVAAAGRSTVWTRTRDRVEDATARVRHSLRTVAAAGVASTLVGTAGVAAAAQSALPGDVLYSIKGLTEDARLAFASGDVAQGRLHLAFARERLEEVERGYARLTPEQLTATLDRLDGEAAAGADELLQAAAREDDGTPLLEELDDFTAEIRNRVLDVSPDLPLSVRPAAERTLEVLRRIDLQVSGLFDLAACEACGADGVLPRVVLPGDGPAAPACQCVGAVPGGDQDGGATTSVPQPDDQPLPPPDPSDPGVVPDGSSTSGPSGQTDDGGDGLVGDLGSEVDGVTEPLDDVGSIVDDLLDPSPPADTDTGLGDPVEDTTSIVEDTTTTVEDTASELVGTTSDLGDPVEDTASSVGDTVGDLGDGLVN